MTHVYVLKLEDDKYYVGKSNNPEFRIDSHMSNSGSVWTKTHKPIQVIKIISNIGPYDEDAYTLKYMEKFGIDNVRGGTFSQFKLDKEYKDIIKRMISTKNDACYKCGGTNHFISECYLNHMDEDVEYNFDNSENDNSSESDSSYHDSEDSDYLDNVKSTNMCDWAISIFTKIKNALCFTRYYHYTDIDNYLQKEEEAYNQKNQYDNEVDSEEDSQDDTGNTTYAPRFGFGKYKGLEYDYVLDKYPSYVKWAEKQKNPSIGLKKFIEYYKYLDNERNDQLKHHKLE